MNKVELMGRHVKDPELSTTPNGTNVTRFTIAVPRRFTTKDGQQQTDFLRCVAWRKTAEIIVKYFRQGRRILLSGNIQSRSWDGKDGKKSYITEIVVEEVYFVENKKHEDGEQEAERESYAMEFGKEDFEDAEFDDENMPF